MRPIIIYTPGINVSGLPLSIQLSILGILIVILILVTINAIFGEKIGRYYSRRKNRKIRRG